MKSSVLGFIVVGAVAAMMHYAVALLVHGAGFSPVDANWAGFLCAVPLSYLGHRRWSFQGTQATHVQALPKFISVALFGFFGNQVLLWLGMHYTVLPFWLVLGFVMVIVAFSTFMLSRWWAFHHG